MTHNEIDVKKEDDGLKDEVVEKWLLKLGLIPDLIADIHTKADLTKWIRKYPDLTLEIVQAFLEISFGVELKG